MFVTSGRAGRFEGAILLLPLCIHLKYSYGCRACTHTCLWCFSTVLAAGSRVFSGRFMFLGEGFVL